MRILDFLGKVLRVIKAGVKYVKLVGLKKILLHPILIITKYSIISAFIWGIYNHFAVEKFSLEEISFLEAFCLRVFVDLLFKTKA